MPTVNLTARSVENWKPNPAKRQEVPDGLCQGLYLLVTERGAKSWTLRYRHEGKPRKYTLGPYPALPLAEARSIARDKLLAIAKGADPASERADAAEAEKAVREADERARRDRFETVAGIFFDRYLKPNNRSADESKRIIDRILIPAWGPRQLPDIGRRDVIELLDGIVDRGSPIMANRTLALVRKLLNWAIERGITEANPAAGISAPGKEKSRDRVLTDEELAEVLIASEALGWPFGPVVRLLVLTAQRRDEVASMRWSEIDFEKAVWTIAANVAKNGKAHEVPLAPAVLSLLGAIPRVGDLVFSTTGRTAVSGFSKAKGKLDTKIMAARLQTIKDSGADPATVQPIGEWRFHDLRRTAASGMAGLGIAPHVIDRALNHISGTIRGVAAVYNRHDYFEERRKALEAWSNFVTSLMARPSSNAVAFAG